MTTKIAFSCYPVVLSLKFHIMKQFLTLSKGSMLNIFIETEIFFSL